MCSKCFRAVVLGLLLALRAAWGEVRIEQWKDLPGSEITDTLAEGQLQRAPDATRTYDNFEGVCQEKPEALSVSGIVRAPAAGKYRFLIAAADTAVLFVSTDGTTANRQQVALVPAYGGRCDWGRYTAQRSDPIELKANQRCFIQAIVKSGEGQGHVEVGWELPGGVIEGPIPGERIETPSDKIGVPSYGVNFAKVSLKQGPAAVAGDHKFADGAHVRFSDKELDMSFLLTLPADYEQTSDSRPLFIFLHGNGHQGKDLGGILNEGPAQFMNSIPELRKWFPMVALYPQLPDGWRWDTPGAAEMTVSLIQQICRQYPRIDRDRIYLSGLSMGGKGTWLTAYANPQLFAAIAPFSSVSVRPQSAGEKLGRIHTWIICGERDYLFTKGSIEMHQAMTSAGCDRVKLTVVPHGEHGCWAQYYPTKSFYEELMKFKRD